MKVIFLFSGLPHYSNLILSKLNLIPNLEIIVVAPKSKKTTTLGKGVYQTQEGINFKVYFLEQYKSLYKYNFKGLVNVLADEKPDILITNFYYAFSLLYNLPLQRVLKKQDIKVMYKEIPFRIPKYQDAVSHHLKALGGESPSFFNKLWMLPAAKILTLAYKRLYHRIDAFVNYIDAGKEIYKSYDVPLERVFVTHNSLDTEVLKETKEQIQGLPPILPPNPHRVFHIGRLVEWKRVDLLIHAVAKLKEKYPRIELLIIGDGPLLDQYKTLVNTLKVTDNVQFLGAIYDDIKKARYFKACSLYVLAGMGGLSINEAMAFGLPVLCSVCDGTEKHLVFEEKNGKYFEDGNQNDLTNKLDYLLANPKRLTQMGAYSEKIIQNEVNVHTVLAGYVNAFNYVSKNKYDLSYSTQELQAQKN